MRRTLFAFSALALAGGCDPGEFGGALDQAPVQFIGAPSGFESNLGADVGRTLLPMLPPADLAPPAGRQTMAARLLFAATHAPGLAVADFDGNGKPQVKAATSEDLEKLGLGSIQDASQEGISSAAWLSAPTPAGTVVLGMPNVASSLGQGAVAFLKLGVDANGNTDFESAGQSPRYGLSAETHFGLAVAPGRVTQAAADEVIALSDRGVHVLGFPSGEVVSASSCAVALPTPPDSHRSLAVADFLPDGDGGGRQEIAVGLPNQDATGPGRVVILQYVSGAAGLSCLIEVSVPGGASPGFGTALAAVPDLNGDGKAELVVGAPPDRAYLFLSPFNLTPPKMLVFSGDAASQFGQRVALVDVDGDGNKELAVTALQANVGSTKAAGQVSIYKLDYTLDAAGNPVAVNSNAIAVVNDSNPISNTEFFGVGLAELEFNNSSPICAKGKDAHLLVVGADAGIFTFFSFAGTAVPAKVLAPDPRCFAQK